MNYDDFKSAVVALGLRNRPYDLSWENNANQLHSNMQQAEHQMIDTTCTSILYNCLFNQREEINFIKAALYSVMTAMLEQKEKDTKQKEKEMKKIQRAEAAAQKKSLLIPPPYPPPRPPTPPPKGKKRPNIERLVETYSQTHLVPDYIQPVLQKKSKKK
jgi:type IV secretory pathway VirB10-like protein